jgi:PAS domain S-box-containing protein
LTEAFNKMARDLYQYDRQLKEYNLQLEERVQRRTSELRKSEEKYRGLYDSSKDGIFFIDMRYRIQDANPAFVEMANYSLSELKQMLTTQLIPKKLHDMQTNVVESQILKRGYSDEYEMEMIKKDGTLLPIAIRAWLLKDDQGQPEGIWGMVRDITEQKRAEHLRQEAERELQRAKEAAEAANQAKSTFLANMSHELRTPLNAVIGYSELLMEEAEDVGQEDFIPDLQKIRSAGKHLLVLINDVLDLSKIEAGKMELYLESFYLWPFIEDVVSTIQPLVEKNGNSLEIHCDDSIRTMYADLTKVRQALFNLLSNACKFTEQGTISLDVSQEITDGLHWVVFKVADTGIGLTREQIGKLFQAFTQADGSTTRKFGGTGLGLMITKHFCQMMGGEIRVESEYGVGTTFTMRLPAQVVDRRVERERMINA